MKFVATSDVLISNEDLGHAATTIPPCCHGIAGRLITIHGVLGVGDALAIQKLLGAHTKWTGAPGVDLDARHGALNMDLNLMQS